MARLTKIEPPPKPPRVDKGIPIPAGKEYFFRQIEFLRKLIDISRKLGELYGKKELYSAYSYAFCFSANFLQVSSPKQNRSWTKSLPSYSHLLTQETLTCPIMEIHDYEFFDLLQTIASQSQRMAGYVNNASYNLLRN